jgi:hypothetical protein
MKFEIGKFYKDSSKKMIAIIEYAKEGVWVAKEGNRYRYRVVGVDSGDYATKWKEIDEEEWSLRSMNEEEENDYTVENKEENPTNELKIYRRGYHDGQLDLMRELK